MQYVTELAPEETAAERSLNQMGAVTGTEFGRSQYGSPSFGSREAAKESESTIREFAEVARDLIRE